MKIHQYREMVRHLTRKPDKVTKASADKLADKLGIKKEDRLSNGSTKTKPMPILSYISAMQKMYGNRAEKTSIDQRTDSKQVKSDTKVTPKTEKFRYQSWADGLEERTRPVDKTEVAGIKDTSLYKLLKNPKVIGMELGHDTIMNLIDIIKSSGIVKKEPKKEIKKIAVAAKPEDPIDHIALLEKNFS